MKKEPIKDAAKKSFIGLKDPYHTVEKIYPNIINKISEKEKFYYTGVKNVSQIPTTLLTSLEQSGNYLLHTIDHSSIGGRAIDINRKNPITGKPMTGSSSGTAINVFLGINDLGIGTDGGGSVLAPAASLNLYGFISTLICQDYVEKNISLSTDNLSFSPSIGYITRSLQEIKRVVNLTIKLPSSPKPIGKIGAVDNLNLNLDHQRFEAEYVNLISPNKFGKRKPLVTFLERELPSVDFIISEEGPVDYHGLGDSILGHFDNQTESDQQNAKKGFLRVVNMANATALIVPKTDFASAYLLICESIPSKIKYMLDFAEKLTVPQDELIERYFRNFDNYFSKGFLE